MSVEGRSWMSVACTATIWWIKKCQCGHYDISVTVATKWMLLSYRCKQNQLLFILMVFVLFAIVSNHIVARCFHLHTHTHTYTHTHTHTHIQTERDSKMHNTFTEIYSTNTQYKIRAYIRPTQTHIHTHTRAHAHTHTHIHAQST